MPRRNRKLLARNLPVSQCKRSRNIAQGWVAFLAIGFYQVSCLSTANITTAASTTTATALSRPCRGGQSCLLPFHRTSASEACLHKHSSGTRRLRRLMGIEGNRYRPPLSLVCLSTANSSLHQSAAVLPDLCK